MAGAVTHTDDFAILGNFQPCAGNHNAGILYGLDIGHEFTPKDGPFFWIGATIEISLGTVKNQHVFHKSESFVEATRC